MVKLIVIISAFAISCVSFNVAIQHPLNINAVKPKPVMIDVSVTGSKRSIVQSYDGRGYLVNTLGYRSEPIHNGVDTHWLFLGDSTTYGLNVDYNSLFTSKIQDWLIINQLNKQVLNLAQPGHGTGAQLALLKNYLMLDQLKPEVLVVGFYKNDVVNDWLLQDEYAVHETVEQLRTRLINTEYDIETMLKMPEWQLTLENLNDIASLAKQNDSILLLVYLPTMDDNFLIQREKSDLLLEQFATGQAIQYISIANVYNDYIDDYAIPKDLYSYTLTGSKDLTHAGVLGHTLIADAIYTKLTNHLAARDIKA
jgi:lysophospholipase L1-like esterase